MSRNAVLLAIGLALIAGCTLNEPKPRQKPSPSTGRTAPEKGSPEKGTVAQRPPPPPQTTEGLPASKPGSPVVSAPTSPISSSGASAGSPATVAGTSPVTNTQTDKPGTSESPETTTPKLMMELDNTGLTTEFQIAGNQTYRYTKSQPEIETSEKKCEMKFEYNENPSTWGRILANISVKVDDHSWKDFVVGVPTQNSQPTKFTESSNGTAVYHNLELSEMKPSGEKQRLTLQYSLINNRRTLSYVTFEID